MEQHSNPAGGRFVVGFAGDASFGENYLADIEAAGGENVLKTRGREHSIARLAPFLAACDLVIANLETPFTSMSQSPFAGRKKFIHWSDTVASPAAFKEHNISVVSLANNHAFDFGPDGMTETLATLERHGFEWFGAGQSAARAKAPFVRTLLVGGRDVRLAVLGAFQYRPAYKRRYDFYARGDAPGVNRLNPEKMAEQIGALKEATPDLFLVVFPHWGENYVWRFPEQEEIAHALVDAGADLIVGHGAHMMGEVERYKGAWVLYSIGNFLFNAPGRYSQREAPPFSFASQLIFEERSGTLERRLRLHPILSDNLQTGFQPRPVNDEEFAEARAILLQRSPALPGGSVFTGKDGFGPYLELN